MAKQDATPFMISDSQFNQISETENFILITPQAINGTWTVTGSPLSGNVNDLGFIDALIKELSIT